MAMVGPTLDFPPHERLLTSCQPYPQQHLSVRISGIILVHGQPVHGQPQPKNEPIVFHLPSFLLHFQLFSLGAPSPVATGFNGLVAPQVFFLYP